MSPGLVSEDKASVAEARWLGWRVVCDGESAQQASKLGRRIADADLTALAAPDLRLADELLADLPAPLAVAAALCDVPMRSQLDEYDAPYGVANYVARWWAP